MFQLEDLQDSFIYLLVSSIHKVYHAKHWLHPYFSIYIGVALSLCGINDSIKVFTIFFSLSLVVGAAVNSSISIYSEIKVNLIEQSFDQLLNQVNLDKNRHFSLEQSFALGVAGLMLGICSISLALRKLEILFGPKNIPDTQISELSARNITSRLIRRSRQGFEFVVFSVWPALAYLAHGQNIDLDLSLILKPFKLSLRRFELLVGLIFVCGVFQRVFGVNPSYKENIHVQYGEVLHKSPSASLFEVDREINDKETTNSIRRSSRIRKTQ